MLNTSRPRKNLSPLEHQVMSLVWAGGPLTAEAVREALAAQRRLKESTVRTILRRLEHKGYLSHQVEGRTYLYRGLEPPQKVAAGAVRQIIDRFCGGSVEQLLVGMVDNEVLDGRELERLAQRIARRQDQKGD